MARNKAAISGKQYIEEPATNTPSRKRFRIDTLDISPKHLHGDGTTSYSSLSQSISSSSGPIPIASWART